MLFNLKYPNSNFAHKVDVGPNFSETFEDHYHLIYEMLYLVDGDIELVIENKQFRLESGDLVLIQPGHHHFIVPNPNARYERYVLKFPEYLVPEELVTALKQKPVCCSVKQTILPQLFARMDWHYSNCTGAGMQLLMVGVLREILVYFCANATSGEQNAVLYNKKMEKVVEYINENIAEPLKISDICEHFHYSKSYMCKEFSKCMDVPIKQYVRTKKILLADSLIKAGMKPTVVYKQCGFSDYSTFFRDYSKIIGRAPSDEKQ